MITKETCVKIWNCHNEIEKSNRLIADMAEVLSHDKEKSPPQLHNAFGDRQGLQLGVPSGSSDAYRLYNVSTDLAVKIIEEHIKMNENRLVELMAIAKLELKG
jgi:hypothetical protein